MNGCLHIVRGNERKLTLPGPSVSIKSDGTLWCEGKPILGIEDQAEKARIITLVKSKKYNQIPAEYFTRLGDNANGLWAGDDAAWEKHPATQAEYQKAQERAAQEAKTVTIYLSSRGWGDFSSVEWHGDITRPANEILAECRKALETGVDVDKPNQSDAELMAKIVAAHEKWEGAPARKAAMEAEEKAHTAKLIANGFCFSCETYCHGDCGHYSSDPTIKHRRDFRQAQSEAGYGINEG